MWTVLAWKRSGRFSRNMDSQKGGHRKPLVECGTERRVAPSSLMSMPHARRHDNEHFPATLRYLLLDADSMPFVRLATQGASEGKWSAPGPQPFKCTPANGLAPMPGAAMATI